MDIQCIALDLDRTTLNKEGRLSEKNRRAIEAVIAAGIHVVIASGRAFDTLPADICSVPGIEYAITCNGAAIYRMSTGECIKRYSLSERAVETVMNVTAGDAVTYEAFINGAAYADRAYIEDPVRFGASTQAVEYIRSTRKPVDDIRDFILRHSTDLDSMDIVVIDDIWKEEIWQKLEAATDEIYITSSVKQLIEISDKQCGKHTGAACVLKDLGLPREALAAFGDADNDIDMLRFAGCGIAMANSSEGCRQAADYVTGHHDEDGLAQALSDILHLIPKDI